MSDRNSLTKEQFSRPDFNAIRGEEGWLIIFDSPNGWRIALPPGDLAAFREWLAVEPKCPCGTAYLRVEGGYVPVCACAAKNSVPAEPKADCPVCHSQLSNLLSGQPRCGNCGWLGSNTPQGG